MLEVKAIYIILLAEGFGVAVLLLILMICQRVRIYRRKRKAVKQLISQIKHQSKIRNEKTGYFLQQNYNLEGGELKQAVNTIDKQEKKFFQKIIKMFLEGDTELVKTMDAALAELVDTYKDLKPKITEVKDSAELDEVLQEIEALRAENERLETELDNAKQKMEGMIGEFGNMFGGGKDHEMAKHEVVEKVVEK